MDIEQYAPIFAKFGLGDYVGAMKSICGDPKDCKFPDYYFGNIRPWDYAQVIQHGKFRSSDHVLEVGALHSYFCLYLSQFIEKYICTDSFYWASRDYCKSEGYQTPAEWCDYITRKSTGKVKGECADIQNLHYKDNSFDKVVCISVIEHVLDDRRGIDELIRVLKPDGLLLLTTEYNSTESMPYSSDAYYRVYDDVEIDKLFVGYNVNIKKPHYTPESGQFTTLFIEVKK